MEAEVVEAFPIFVVLRSTDGEEDQRLKDVEEAGDVDAKAKGDGAEKHDSEFPQPKKVEE